jgi:nitrate reductase beta subunit
MSTLVDEDALAARLFASPLDRLHLAPSAAKRNEALEQWIEAAQPSPTYAMTMRAGMERR